MNKKRRINWENVIYGITFIICSLLIITDLCKVTIFSWITGNYCGLTWFGLVIDSLALMFGIMSFAILCEESKKDLVGATTKSVVSCKK